MNPQERKTRFIEGLTPKMYHFDGYNAVNVPGNNIPFFKTQTVKLGNYLLSIDYHAKDNIIYLKFENICPYGIVTFESYWISFDDFVNKIKAAVNNSCNVITFPIAVSYDNSCPTCHFSNPHCKSILIDKPSYKLAAITFDFKDMQNCLSEYLGIKNNSYGGKTTMENRNKLIGLNLEFGALKDSRIACTLAGVAVKNNSGDWVVFNGAQGSLKNYKSLKIGSLPLLLIPIKNPSPGDLLKIDRNYYYVREVKNNALVLIGAADGVIQERIKEESLIPGLDFYTKVIAFNQANFTDSANNDVSGNLLAAILLNLWSSNDGGAKFSLDNIGDSFNGLGDNLLPLLLANNSGILSNVFGGTDIAGNLPLLLALGGDSNNDATQLLILSQLLDKKQPLNNFVLGAPAGGEVVCTGCGKHYPSADTKFCPDCGAVTKSAAKLCKKCNAVLKADAAFCHNCGAKAAEVAVCPVCGKELADGAKFCSKCGAPVNQAVVCKNCGRELNADEKFCPKCGTPAGKAPTVKCAQCGKELEDDEKFCSECGNPVAPVSEPAAPPVDEATKEGE